MSGSTRFPVLWNRVRLRPLSSKTKNAQTFKVPMACASSRHLSYNVQRPLFQLWFLLFQISLFCGLLNLATKGLQKANMVWVSCLFSFAQVLLRQKGRNVNGRALVFLLIAAPVRHACQDGRRLFLFFNSSFRFSELPLTASCL